MYGKTNPAAGADPAQGLYGAGRFGYSLNQKSASLTGAVVKATWADVNYDPTLSASIAAGVTFSALSIDSISNGFSLEVIPDVSKEDVSPSATPVISTIFVICFSFTLFSPLL